MRCKEAPSTTLPISPLVGEMSGRTEGGAKECRPSGSLAVPDDQYFSGTYSSRGSTWRSYSGLKTRSGSVISSCGTSS
ncbi:MAG: hypothetical protein E5Y69_22125 [Mesorhizobium sp.]|nr:MAG: hypothetical protein E5Y69_22125 [Mesorhizobium sp.]